MSEEISSTSTADLTLNLKIPFTDLGIGGSGSIVFGNDFDPNDGAIWQFVDQLIPDDIGFVLNLSGGDSVGVGGYVATTATVYSHSAPVDVMLPGSTTTSVTAPVTPTGVGYTAHMVFDQVSVVRVFRRAEVFS
ncbi:hypothetical protein SAMN05444003_2465 [Cognatiyoonia sediminum]|uniref:Uncharacterized protein n=1 Tax=Cognatiyoonia sediminum TaxID=1508389 RepID=A0A1M5R228_9RHOB|nr:hypothetical protein [Cognatiyoonia sediminum]SHH20475.1 hypothetical protein SAMN05444003_2465 [Cognatiyoonia sediminum]